MCSRDILYGKTNSITRGRNNEILIYVPELQRKQRWDRYHEGLNEITCTRKMEYTGLKEVCGRNTVYIEVIECLRGKGAPRRIVLK